MSDGSDQREPGVPDTGPGGHRILLPAAFGWVLAILCWAAVVALLVWLF